MQSLMVERPRQLELSATLDTTRLDSLHLLLAHLPTPTQQGTQMKLCTFAEGLFLALFKEQ